MDLIQRPRRLRGSETLRKMVRETRIDKSSLIYPLFVKEGTGVEEEIPSMEGQYRYSVDRLPYELERLQKAGVSNIMLFGIPDHKDEVGSGAYDENGIVQKALREAKKQFPDLYYITDVCMCEYTVNVWTRQGIKKLRSCLMQSNMHLHFMVRFVMLQVLLHPLVTVRVIRWIFIIVVRE